MTDKVFQGLCQRFRILDIFMHSPVGQTFYECAKYRAQKGTSLLFCMDVE